MRRMIPFLLTASLLSMLLPDLGRAQVEAWQLAQLQSAPASQQAISGVGVVMLKRPPSACV